MTSDPNMPTLADVYCKFGNASEAAQLLETELGNLLLQVGIIDADLIDQPDRMRARAVFEATNRQTLGQLLKSLNRSTDSVVHLEALLARALTERNRLSHSFYRQHNFRRNSEDGRAVMMRDLEAIHSDLLDAYKAVMLLSGHDLDGPMLGDLPARHLPL
jgi:hypothetical protein